MPPYEQAALQTAATGDDEQPDIDECDECAALPGAFPCAECYTTGAKDLPEAGR